jgi:hypothetical protein
LLEDIGLTFKRTRSHIENNETQNNARNTQSDSDRSTISVTIKAAKATADKAIAIAPEYNLLIELILPMYGHIGLSQEHPARNQKNTITSEPLVTRIESVAISTTIKPASNRNNIFLHNAALHTHILIHNRNFNLKRAHTAAENNPRKIIKPPPARTILSQFESSFNASIKV